MGLDSPGSRLGMPTMRQASSASRTQAATPKGDSLVVRISSECSSWMSQGALATKALNSSLVQPSKPGAPAVSWIASRNLSKVGGTHCRVGTGFMPALVACSRHATACPVPLGTRFQTTSHSLRISAAEKTGGAAVGFTIFAPSRSACTPKGRKERRQSTNRAAACAFASSVAAVSSWAKAAL